MKKFVSLSISQNKSWGENGQQFGVPVNISLFFRKIIIFDKDFKTFKTFKIFKNKFLGKINIL